MRRNACDALESQQQLLLLPRAAAPAAGCVFRVRDRL
jgi:hypothetical protein